MSNMEIFLIY